MTTQGSAQVASEGRSLIISNQLMIFHGHKLGEIIEIFETSMLGKQLTYFDSELQPARCELSSKLGESNGIEKSHLAKTLETGCICPSSGTVVKHVKGT